MKNDSLSIRWYVRANRNGIAAVIGRSLLVAALTGLLAGLRVHLPFTPVPLTGQVIGVLLAGLLLEAKAAGLSQLLYLLIGLSGVPWFAGWTGLTAIGFLSAPSAGYLLGFIPAAYLIGAMLRGRRNNFGVLLTAFCSGIVVLHFFGAWHLSAVLGTGFRRTLQLAVFPFILFDCLKALLVASFMTGFWPVLVRHAKKSA